MNRHLINDNTKPEDWYLSQLKRTIEQVQQFNQYPLLQIVSFYFKGIQEENKAYHVKGTDFLFPFPFLKARTEELSNLLDELPKDIEIGKEVAQKIDEIKCYRDLHKRLYANDNQPQGKTEAKRDIIIL